MSRIDGVSLPESNLAHNLIINGNFDIWQRGTSFASTSNPRVADRWRVWSSGPGAFDVIQAGPPDALSDIALKVDVTTGDATIAAGAFYYLQQIIEGRDARALGFGNALAKTASLSFWARSSVAGTYCVALRNNSANRTLIKEYEIDVASTWEFKTIKIEGDQVGSWLGGVNPGIIVSWCLAAGSTHHTAADVWTAGNFLASANQANVMNSFTDTFRLSRVRLEVGSVETPFVGRTFTEELALCQRYFWKTFAYATAPASSAGDVGAIEAIASGGGVRGITETVYLPLPMRVAPTIVTYNPSAAGSDWDRSATAIAAAVDFNSERGFVLINNAATNDGWQHKIHATADAEL